MLLGLGALVGAWWGNHSSYLGSSLGFEDLEPGTRALLNRVPTFWSLPRNLEHCIFPVYFGLAYLYWNWWLYSKIRVWIYFFLDYDRPCWAHEYLALQLTS